MSVLSDDFDFDDDAQWERGYGNQWLAWSWCSVSHKEPGLVRALVYAPDVNGRRHWAAANAFGKERALGMALRELGEKLLAEHPVERPPVTELTVQIGNMELRMPCVVIEVPPLNDGEVELKLNGQVYREDDNLRVTDEHGNPLPSLDWPDSEDD